MRIILAAVSWGGMVNSYPPLGLGYLASVLHADPEINANIQIMDFGLEPFLTSDQALSRILKDGPPDLLGFSSLTHNYKSTIELARLVKEATPSVKIVLGGPHPSVDPGKVAACKQVDAVVYGEGENTLLELVKRMAAGEWPTNIPGTVLSTDGELTTNPPRQLIKDLDSIPFPARNLMNIEKYSLQAPDGRSVFTVLSSRGCPYSCAYCFKGIFGRKYRTRSAENILAEIQFLIQEYDARNIYFGDDIFMISADRVDEICHGILERGLDISWSCLARVDVVTLELLRTMKKAGCSKIHYGIESGCQNILDRINKKIDLNAVEKAVKWTKEAEIMSKGYFMAGLPGDTKESLSRTLDFAQRLKLDDVMFSLATPFPGTELHNELAEKGLEPNREDYNRAFYFDVGAGRVKESFNLSDLETPQLERFVTIAQSYFRHRKNKADFKRRYGAVIGPIAHKIWRLTGGDRTQKR